MTASHRLTLDFDADGELVRLEHVSLDGTDLGWADLPDSKYQQALATLRRTLMPDEKRVPTQEQVEDLVDRYPDPSKG